MKKIIIPLQNTLVIIICDQFETHEKNDFTCVNNM